MAELCFVGCEDLLFVILHNCIRKMDDNTRVMILINLVGDNLL